MTEAKRHRPLVIRNMNELRTKDDNDVRCTRQRQKKVEGFLMFANPSSSSGWKSSIEIALLRAYKQ